MCIQSIPFSIKSNRWQHSIFSKVRPLSQKHNNLNKVHKQNTNNIMDNVTNTVILADLMLDIFETFMKHSNRSSPISKSISDYIPEQNNPDTNTHLDNSYDKQNPYDTHKDIWEIGDSDTYDRNGRVF